MFIIHIEEPYFARPKLDDAFLMDTEGVLCSCNKSFNLQIAHHIYVMDFFRVQTAQ